MKDKIGLVGLGLVGTAIAERLLAGDFDVVGFDIDSARCKHFQQLGGKAASSSAEVAQAAKRVVLSLPDTDIVRQVVEGPAGILEAKTPPQYIIDTTTGGLFIVKPSRQSWVGFLVALGICLVCILVMLAILNL